MPSGQTWVEKGMEVRFKSQKGTGSTSKVTGYYFINPTDKYGTTPHWVPNIDVCMVKLEGHNGEVKDSELEPAAVPRKWHPLRRKRKQPLPKCRGHKGRKKKKRA